MTQDPLVYLIDSDPIDRESVGQKLRESNLEYRAFTDPDSFAAALDLRQLGCVLTELKLGGSTAFQLVKRLRERKANLPIVLLTSYATVPLTVQAFKAGFFEVLEKPSTSFQLWDCATRAFENHSQELNESQRCNELKNRFSKLSLQELEVMQMILDGEPNKRIASQLGLSPRTIVFRRKSLMLKMNTKSIGELAYLVHVISHGMSRLSSSELMFPVDVRSKGSQPVLRQYSRNGNSV